MLVQLQDRMALSSLSILSLRSYLTSHGWVPEGSWGSRPAIIYAKEHGGRSWEILVPTRDTIADYAESMADSVEVLAAVEERSQLDVFYDLSASGADVIRMRSVNGMTEQPLSLRRSANLLKDAYDMLAASARAAEKPRPAYRGKMSSDVADYLDKVHHMPSHYQGYALTLHSPVPVGFGRQEDFGDDFSPPFSRLATSKLAEGLGHASKAIEQVVAVDSLEPFSKVVNYGVSANLCDSLAELAKRGHGIEIELTWAEVRPAGVPDSHFQFSSTSADILVEAAKTFRLNEPFLDERIVAQVVRLDREPAEFDGRATVLYMRNSIPIRMQAVFERNAYETVIQAFRERDPINIDGDIYRVGNAYELRSPRNLSLLAEAKESTNDDSA